MSRPSRPGSPLPRYLRLDPDTNEDGLPDNWSTAYYEKMPFNTPGFSDWYYRPVYHNMTFKDVQIDEGTNALFLNCTFVGVTYVKSATDNTHRLGRVRQDADGHGLGQAQGGQSQDRLHGQQRLDEVAPPPSRRTRRSGSPARRWTRATSSTRSPRPSATTCCPIR
jgi:hypothetical protein